MKKKIFLNVFVTVGLLVIIAANFIFLKEVGRYGLISFDTKAIERNGDSIVYTKDGATNGWEVNPDLATEYEKMKNEKSELIKSSDVAKWVSKSAETITGQVVRLVAIFTSAMLLVLAAYALIRVLLQDMGYLIEILRIE